MADLGLTILTLPATWLLSILDPDQSEASRLWHFLEGVFVIAVVAGGIIWLAHR